ncbi:cation:proton antiporter [Desulforhabdus sp. TSK]|uniref:cation:proton antiporter n=1 Tax=Desulforhabdus sp. TSK TaxID=2925014 RepID=UPI001FC828F0|nr:cation:proton antiporter [Desulforhabdus sp. TSK]GKT08410.1 cation:proton antiporter [Desulforhabdus sp. TSK]
MSLHELIFYSVVAVLTLSILLAFIRLMKGPSLPDRVVALEAISTMGIGVIAVYTVTTGEGVFLDVAMILALVSFLGTVALAYYIQKPASSEEGD